MLFLSSTWNLRAVLAIALIPGLVCAQAPIRVRADNVPEWGENIRLAHEFTIGEVDGPPEIAFGRVNLLAADSAGSFYIFDDNDTQIRWYDARGNFVRRIGRRGGGPGEYQRVAAVEITRDGLLVVYDPSSQRITWFDADGKLRRELTLSRAFDARGFILDSAGRAYLKNRLPRPLEGPDARHQYLRVSPSGALIDSILHPAETLAVGSAFMLVTTDGARSSFQRETLVAPYSLGGMITAQSTAYRLMVTNPGQPPLIVNRPHSPVRLRDDERAEWLALAADMRGRALKREREFEIPREKPAIRGLFSDHLGRIWVDVYVAAEKRTSAPRPGRPPLTWRERTTYDVFSPRCSFLGRIQLPAEHQLRAIRDDRVYLLSKGADGEDRVSVYRITAADPRVSAGKESVRP